MSQVKFTFNSGRSVITHIAQARLLKQLHKGDYQTTSMADAPMAHKLVPVTKPVIQAQVSDGLDDLNREELHALAKERGLKLHHMLGADKVRAALRAAE